MTRQAQTRRQQATNRPRRRTEDRKTGLTVFEPNTVYFGDFLEIYIGAKWNTIKGSLYDAGYKTAEVSRYRDELLADFRKLCEKNNLHGII